MSRAGARYAEPTEVVHQFALNYIDSLAAARRSYHEYETENWTLTGLACTPKAIAGCASYPVAVYVPLAVPLAAGISAGYREKLS